METAETRPSFRDQLQKKWDEGKFVCVGLDLDRDKIPQHLKIGTYRSHGFEVDNSEKD